MNRRLYFVFLFSILFVAGFLRFYRLGVNPPGLYYDEAFFANLAYSILSTGRDFNGVFLPLFSFGHGTSILPLQFYPLVASVFVFGFDVFAVRFVPALLGVLIVLVTFLLARFLFNDFVGLLSAFLVAVSPWHVVYSRVGFGILQLTFFFSLGLYLFLRGLKGDGRLMVLGGFCFSLAFFSYYLAHVFVLLFLFGFHCLFYNEIKSGGKLRLYYFSLLIMALLAVLSLAISYVSKINVVLPADSVSQLFSNFFDMLLAIFLLKDNWNWPLRICGFGVIYSLYVPLLFLGVFLLFRSKDGCGRLLVYLLFTSLVIGSFISNPIEGGSVRRAFACAGPTFEIVVAYAAYRILSFYRNNKRVFCLLAFLMSFSLLLGVYQFLVHYFVYQPASIETEKVFMVPVRELFNYTESVRNRYDTVLFTSNFDTTHWPNWPSVTFKDYYVFYTQECIIDSKYVVGNVSSYLINNKTLFVVRDFELANATPEKVFPYSNGEVAYKVIS